MQIFDEVVDSPGGDEGAETSDIHIMDRAAQVENVRVCVTDPEAVDSHFHLDKLRRERRISELNFDLALEDLLPPNHRRVTLRGAVAVFCDPCSYPSRKEVRALNSWGLAVTVGMHPRNAELATSVSMDRMRELCHRH